VKSAEGDEILGEEVERRREVDSPHMLGEFAKPGFDCVEIRWNGLLRAEAHGVALWEIAADCCECLRRSTADRVTRRSGARCRPRARSA
jgi:hypothetical protein